MSARWREIALAGHAGDTATALSALTDPDPSARELAIGALERLGALTEELVIAALSDQHPTVRRRALMAAAARPSIDIGPMLSDPDQVVVEVAAWAAGEQADPTHLARLCTLATDADDPLVREAAVAALGAIGDPAGLPAILAACHDKPAVRRRAVLALAPFDGPAVEAALAAALEDRDWQVRQAAEDVLPTADPNLSKDF